MISSTLSFRYRWMLCLSMLLVSCEERQPLSAIEGTEITIDPIVTSLLTGDSVQFSATVSGIDDQSIRWSLLPHDAGRITSDGVYYAPEVIGQDSLDVVIIATSVANTNVKSTLNLTIVQAFKALKIPEIGSSYTFSFYKIDTSGRKEPGSDQSWTWRVADRGLTVDGRTNVLLMERDSSLQYYHYEANGDVSVSPIRSMTSNQQITWWRYPFISHDWVTYDSTYERRNSETELRAVNKATFAGLDQFEVNGKTFLALKVNKQYSETRTGLEWYSLRTDRIYWFIPELGVIARIEATMNYSDYEDDVFRFGERTSMTSYQPG